MLLDQLFEDVERCFDDIDLCKRRLADVLGNTQGLCLRHGLLHAEIKQLRKEVVGAYLELNEKKCMRDAASDEMALLESKLDALEHSLLAKADTLARKELGLNDLKSKLGAILSSLRNNQRSSNIKLLQHYDVEETSFKLRETFIGLVNRIRNVHACLRGKSLIYDKNLKEIRHDIELKGSALTSVVCEMTSVRQELSECIDEVDLLERAKSLLERKLITAEYEQRERCKELEELTDATALCHCKLEEVTKSLEETQASINICALVLSNLENERSCHIRRRDSATLMASKLQDTLAELSNEVETLNKDLSLMDDEITRVSTDVKHVTVQRSLLERRVDDIRMRALDCEGLLSSISGLKSSMDTMKDTISGLLKQHTALTEEISQWTAKNATLKNDLDRHQMGLLDLQETKSSLASAMESEAVRSANISKEVEVLNKEITQSRIFLGDLSKQYELEQTERDSRLQELQQRHLDEYKEKLSVKICDIKSDLKRQRESVIQEKRETCSRSLEECAAILQSGFADLVKDHRRQLDGDALVIANLQEELRVIGLDVTN